MESSPNMPEETWIVVENAGYAGERDVGEFDNRRAAETFIGRTYAPDEVDSLHVELAVEVDGNRTFEVY